MRADAGAAMTGGTFELTGGFWPAFTTPDTPPPPPGDANCDGAADFFDIDAFLPAQFDLPAYLATHGCGSIATVGRACSGGMNFFDIVPSVNCLLAQDCDCP